MSRNQENQEPSLENLQSVLLAISGPASQEIIIEWLKNNPISLENFDQKILQRVAIDLRPNLIRLWVLHNENNVENVADLLRFLPEIAVADGYAGNASDISSSASEESESEDESDDIEEIAHIESGSENYDSLPEDESDDIEEIAHIEFAEDEIMSGSSEIEDGTDSTPEVSTNYYPSIRALFAWIEKQQNDPILADLSENVLPRLRSNDAIRLTKTWLAKTAHNPTITELLATSLTHDGLTHEEGSFLISAWMKKDGNNITFQDLRANIFPLLAYRESYVKLLNRWFEKNNMTFAELAENLNSLNGNDHIATGHLRSSLFAIWASKAGNSCSFVELKNQILPLIPQNANELITWIAKVLPEELTYDNFKEIMPQFIRNGEPLDHAITLWIHRAPILNDKAQIIASAIMESDNALNFSDVISFLKTIDDAGQYIPYLCKTFYSYDDGLLCYFVLRCVNQQILTDRDLEYLNECIELIAGDNSARNTLREAYNELHLSPQITEETRNILDAYLVEISYHRLASRYKIVTSLLGQEPLENIAKSAEIATNLKRLVHRPDLTAAELFAFLDLYNDDIPNFLNVVSPAFKTRLNSFLSPKEHGYIAPQEYQKLNALSENRIIYPKIETLCDYLKTKIAPEPNLNDPAYIAGYQINFGNSLIDEAGQQSLNDLFKLMLTMTQGKLFAQESALVNFFSLACAIEDLEQVTNADNKKKLCQFFYDSKARLAQLLRQPECLEKLQSCIFSLTDGCAANIGTQMMLSLYQSLITEELNKEVYIYFQQQIFTKIVNNDAGDLINIHSDPLENEWVRNHLASPRGILQGLTSQIVKGGLRCSNFILEALREQDLLQLAEEARGTLYDLLTEYPYNLTISEAYEKTSEIAARLALCKAMPSIIAHPDLAEMAGEHEGYLAALRTRLQKERADKQSEHSAPEDEGGDQKRARLENDEGASPEHQADSPAEEIKQALAAAAQDMQIKHAQIP